MQGSVVGPLQFLIHIYNINNEISDSTVTCFTDSTRIHQGIKDEVDIQMPQNDLHNLYISAATNNMKFNANKFELLRYGTKGMGNDNSIIYKS